MEIMTMVPNFWKNVMVQKKRTQAEAKVVNAAEAMGKAMLAKASRVRSTRVWTPRSAAAQ